MVWLDYFILTLVFLSFLIGFRRGFCWEILSLLTWLSAFFLRVIIILISRFGLTILEIVH